MAAMAEDHNVEPLCIESAESLPVAVKEASASHTGTVTAPAALLLLAAAVNSYATKFLGVAGKEAPPLRPLFFVVASAVLGFVGILLVSCTDNFFLASHFDVDGYGVKMLSGAYAATAVLVYDAFQSPLAQPRNVIGGYIVCSIVGVSVRLICGLIGLEYWVSGACALGFGIAAMNLTKTVHPPGGACALIAVIGGPMVHSLGYGYVLTSAGGAIIMVSVALLGNNLLRDRQYPLYWW